MAKELILRKGTAAQHSTFIGKLAELTVITDTKDLALHDNSTAGGIVLAKKINLDNHMSNINNPHGVTKSQIGLSNVDNTSDADKNVLSATKLTTARNIALTGDVTGNINFDGSANVSIATTIAANSVALGTDTTGNYVAGATAGTGISISGTEGEGWSPTITNTAPNVTTDISITHNASSVVVNSSDGLDGTINAATSILAGIMTAADKTKLDGIATGATANTGTVTSIATTGAITGGTITTTGTISHSTADGFLHVPATGTTNNGKVLTAGATAGSLSWTNIPSVPVTSVAGKTGNVTLVKGDVGLGSVDNTADNVKNVLSATKLTTARTIAGVAFDGTADISIPFSGISAKPTTLSGYGITDAYAKTEIDNVNLLRADKYLASQNIAQMIYSNGSLTKIQYNNASDIDYEILNYTNGNLTSVDHYINSILFGTTTLSYTSGSLVSVVFAGA